MGRGREATQDRALDLADMGEVPIDQCLAKIASGLAIVARLTIH
jgi:hypothetical protein